MTDEHEDRVRRRVERLKAQQARPKPRADMVAAIERRAKELVDQAPPLTQEQLDKLAQIFGRNKR